MGDGIKCKPLYVLDFHNGIGIIGALNINIDDVRYIRLELMRLVVNKFIQHYIGALRCVRGWAYHSISVSVVRPFCIYLYPNKKNKTAGGRGLYFWWGHRDSLARRRWRRLWGIRDDLTAFALVKSTRCRTLWQGSRPFYPNKKIKPRCGFFFWWGHRDSNPGPND